MAENIEGEIVEFDSNAPVGAYVGSEDEQEDYPGNDDDLFEESRTEHELEMIVMRGITDLPPNTTYLEPGEDDLGKIKFGQ